MRICKYCGTENKNNAEKCSECGANDFNYKCDNCGNIFEDGLYCPKCGVKINTKCKVCPQCETEYYSNACPNCGYSKVDNKDMQTYDGANVSDEKRKKKTWLWVLGWICFFPIPLSILIWRSKLDKRARIIIIAALWVVILIAGLLMPPDSTDVTNDNSSQQTVNSVEEDGYTYVDKFIETFNEKSDKDIVDVDIIDIADKDNGHYRVEFRLPVFQNAKSKTGTIDNLVVDVIDCTGDIDLVKNFRVYLKGEINNKDLADIISIMLLILDPNISDEQISGCTKDLIENDTLDYNGLINNVSATMFKEDYGYDIMLDISNPEFMK